MKPPIYLDFNGTTPLDPEVVQAMQPFWGAAFGNPSSSHAYGMSPREAVTDARLQVARLLACRPEEVIFTSGGTEANNHAIKGILMAEHRGGHIITTSVEHPAVLEVCRFLERFGIETTYLPVNTVGCVDPDQIERAIRPDTALISVMHANNEVGTLQPIATIGTLARAHGIPFHTDAAQSIGKIPTHAADLKVDLLSMAGHKLYAPKGIGVLFVRMGLTLENVCHGAGQDMGRRAGTENVALIAGLGKACEIAVRDLTANETHMRAMRDRLHRILSEELEGVVLNGPYDNRLPNTLSLAFTEVAADRLLTALGTDVAASAGAACHADKVAISHVLEAMHVPHERARGTIRFSVGKTTTAEEIDRAAAAIVAAVNHLRVV